MPEHRDAAAVRVFPPGIPLATILLGVGLNWMWPIDLGFAIPRPERYWLGGLIVAGAFLGLKELVPADSWTVLFLEILLGLIVYGLVALLCFRTEDRRDLGRIFDRVRGLLRRGG